MSFLKAYADYAGRLTDAPPLFHTWVGIALLAAVLGNDCWAWAWGRRLCPNVWVVLLAGSGMFRKTTAVTIGQRILSAAVPEAIWPGEWSFEALLQTMVARPAGILVVREFRRFHQATSRDYAGGSKELLVDAYDNPELDVRRTRMGGETKVQFPAPSLLAATTSEWFELSLRQDDVGGGFLARMFIIPAEEKGEWRGIDAKLSDADHEVRESLVAHLKGVNARMRGELNLSEVVEPFNGWLRHYEGSWESRCNPELTGTISRSGANALKLAMILQADREPSTTLGVEAFERARELVEFTNATTARLLAEGLGLTREQKERKRLLEAVRQAYPDVLDHSTALRNTHLSAKAIEGHVRTLVEAGEIIVEPRAGQGRPGKTYKWLNGASP